MKDGCLELAPKSLVMAGQLSDRMPSVAGCLLSVDTGRAGDRKVVGDQTIKSKPKCLV